MKLGQITLIGLNFLSRDYAMKSSLPEVKTRYLKTVFLSRREWDSHFVVCDNELIFPASLSEANTGELPEFEPQYVETLFPEAQRITFFMCRGSNPRRTACKSERFTGRHSSIPSGKYSNLKLLY